MYKTKIRNILMAALILLCFLVCGILYSNTGVNAAYAMPSSNEESKTSSASYEFRPAIEKFSYGLDEEIPMDELAINEKFGTYLNENVLNAQQQEFVKTIINYVNENGDIEREDLLNTSPFDDLDILELFGEKIKNLNYIINTAFSFPVYP